MTASKTLLCFYGWSIERRKSVCLEHDFLFSGFILICFYLGVERVSSSPFSEDQTILEKRRSEGHTRAAIPLFRGSNLGIFVRKRPSNVPNEHSMARRKESRSSLTNDDIQLAEYLYGDGHQRHFDDYSESLGPIFGR